MEVADNSSVRLRIAQHGRALSEEGIHYLDQSNVEPSLNLIVLAIPFKDTS